MAHSEACQLYIEQFIEERLAVGQSAYSIGKELKADIEKKFETCISLNTLRSRAWHMRKKKSGANAPPPPTPANPSEIQEKQVPNKNITPQEHSISMEKQDEQLRRGENGRFIPGTSPSPGPGRPAKYEKAENCTLNPLQEETQPRRRGRKRRFVTQEKPSTPTVPSDALYFATIAISQLERIAADDPKRKEALQKVRNWIDRNP